MIEIAFEDWGFEGSELVNNPNYTLIGTCNNTVVYVRGKPENGRWYLHMLKIDVANKMVRHVSIDMGLNATNVEEGGPPVIPVYRAGSSIDAALLLWLDDGYVHIVRARIDAANETVNIVENIRTNVVAKSKIGWDSPIIAPGVCYMYNNYHDIYRLEGGNLTKILTCLGPEGYECLPIYVDRRIDVYVLGYHYWITGSYALLAFCKGSNCTLIQNYDTNCGMFMGSRRLVIDGRIYALLFGAGCGYGRDHSSKWYVFEVTSDGLNHVATIDTYNILTADQGPRIPIILSRKSGKIVVAVVARPWGYQGEIGARIVEIDTETWSVNPVTDEIKRSNDISTRMGLSGWREWLAGGHAILVNGVLYVPVRNTVNGTFRMVRISGMDAFNGDVIDVNIPTIPFWGTLGIEMS